MLAHLKKKWGIESNWDFFLIMLIFSLAGMMVTLTRKPVFALIGITPQTRFWIKAVVYIPLIVPIYQASLLFFGLIFGQFAFFWEKEKRIGRAIRGLFRRMRSAMLS